MGKRSGCEVVMKQVNSGDTEEDQRFPRGQTLQAKMDVTQDNNALLLFAEC